MVPSSLLGLWNGGPLTSIRDWFRFGVESLAVGLDRLSPLSKTYEKKLPFAVTSTIEKAVLNLK